jgi:hypothetical protein
MVSYLIWGTVLVTAVSLVIYIVRYYRQTFPNRFKTGRWFYDRPSKVQQEEIRRYRNGKN